MLLARVAFIGLLMSLCLYGFTPGLSRYVGMSGVIHGLFVLGLLPQVRQRDLVSMGCLAFLIGKLVFEQIAGAPLSDESAIGGHVVTESHLFGALAAALYAAPSTSVAASFLSRGSSSPFLADFGNRIRAKKMKAPPTP